MTDTEATKPAYEGWAIVELMGRRVTAGEVRQVVLAGSAMLRIDTPGANGEKIATQLYGGTAIYCVTPCDEATARKALEETYALSEPIRLALRQADAALPPPDQELGKPPDEDAGGPVDDNTEPDDEQTEYPF
jgi:hypothetical protein